METSSHFTSQDFEWAVKFHRFTLELICLWPKPAQNTRDKFICNLRLLFILTLIISFIQIPTIHSVIRIYGNIMLMVDNLQYSLPISTSVMRILIFWKKKGVLIPLVDMMANDWARPKTMRQKMMMIRRAQTAHIIIWFGYVIMLIGFVVACILPFYGISMRNLSNITDPGRPLPLQAYYVYDVTKSPQFELTFALQDIAAFFCILSYTGVDNFLSLMIFHISGQLDILADRLTNLDRYENYNNALKSCVQHHVRLLRAIAVIEDTFNIMLLVLFLYFGILFAFYGFLIISLLQDEDYHMISDMAYLLILIINTFGHMCLYCAVGDVLTAQYERIHHQVYCNKWYNVDAKYVRNIVLLMAKSGKPLYLTAGKLFPLTMATFCNLLKTSAGYVSILLATKN